MRSFHTIKSGKIKVQEKNTNPPDVSEGSEKVPEQLNINSKAKRKGLKNYVLTQSLLKKIKQYLPVP